MKEPIEVRWRFVIDPVADPLLHEWYEQLPPGRRRGRILSNLLSRAVAMERAVAEGRVDGRQVWGYVPQLGFLQQQGLAEQTPQPPKEETVIQVEPAEVHAEITDDVWANGLGDMLSAFEIKP